jgi:GNAT superfamily N-acetyltransferase
MVDFVPVPFNQWEVLHDILNSQPEFLWILRRKKALNQLDILKYLQKSKSMNNQVAFIKKGRHYVGIIDYQWKSPQDGHPWIGLLLIHRQYEKQGIGSEAFARFESMVNEKRKSVIRLGVHEKNDAGYFFWTKQGFAPFKHFILHKNPMIGLEKKIL